MYLAAVLRQGQQADFVCGWTKARVGVRGEPAAGEPSASGVRGLAGGL